MEGALRYGWDWDAYGKVAEKDSAEAEGKVGDNTINFELQNEAIGSQLFWGLLVGLAGVAQWLSTFMELVDGCMCHWKVLREFRGDTTMLIREVMCRCQACPCRGMMAPWFAVGELFELLEELGEATATSVRAELERTMTAEDLVIV